MSIGTSATTNTVIFRRAVPEDFLTHWWWTAQWHGTARTNHPNSRKIYPSLELKIREYFDANGGCHNVPIKFFNDISELDDFKFDPMKQCGVIDSITGDSVTIDLLDDPFHISDHPDDYRIGIIYTVDPNIDDVISVSGFYIMPKDKFVS